mgnify:FL=1
MREIDEVGRIIEALDLVIAEIQLQQPAVAGGAEGECWKLIMLQVQLLQRSESVIDEFSQSVVGKIEVP